MGMGGGMTITYQPVIWIDYLTGLQRVLSKWELPVSGIQLAMKSLGIDTNGK